jgi:hypothetical protein
MWPGAKACCAPNGHCKTKTAPQKDAGRECKQIAFDQQKCVDYHIDLPLAALSGFDLPQLTATPFTPASYLEPPEHSPPDLQILNSIFLI